jgi:hypothetical protein
VNALIFTDADAQLLIAAQTGQHRLAPVRLTDGRWFLMADVLTEMPDGIYDGKIQVPYTVVPFADIAGLMPEPDAFPSPPTDP